MYKLLGFKLPALGLKGHGVALRQVPRNLEVFKIQKQQVENLEEKLVTGKKSDLTGSFSRKAEKIHKTVKKIKNWTFPRGP